MELTNATSNKTRQDNKTISTFFLVSDEGTEIFVLRHETVMEDTRRESRDVLQSPSRTTWDTQASADEYKVLCYCCPTVQLKIT